MEAEAEVWLFCVCGGLVAWQNSTLQLLFTLPELKQHYYDRYRDLVMGRAVADPAGDHLTQMAKLSLGLLSDRYAPPATEEESRQVSEKGGDTDFTTSVEPRMFKVGQQARVKKEPIRDTAFSPC